MAEEIRNENNVNETENRNDEQSSGLGTVLARAAVKVLEVGVVAGGCVGVKKFHDHVTAKKAEPEKKSEEPAQTETIEAELKKLSRGERKKVKGMLEATSILSKAGYTLVKKETVTVPEKNEPVNEE